jgi:predicted nucleotidyltransferase
LTLYLKLSHKPSDESELVIRDSETADGKMTAQEQEILTGFKRRLQERLPVDKLVLFGSRARGDADPDSDMDVLVVLNTPVDWTVQKAVSECAWEASVFKNIVLAPIAVYREEWEDGPESSSLLALAVNREGVPL